LVTYKGGICERCKAQAHPAAFDFHHQNPADKSFRLAHSNMDLSWQRLTTEADKCHLLCANCHRIVHYEKEQKFFKT
jgi:hypothetical protein